MRYILHHLIFVACFARLAAISNAQISPYSLSPDWYFGQGGRLTFPTGNFKSSAAPTAAYKGTNISTGVEASTSICYADGSVALYTNTMQAYNANPANTTWTNFMRSFTTDNTCAGSSTGGAVAFPDPASPTTAFYVVIANDVTGGGCAGQGVNRYRFTVSGTYLAYNAGPTNMTPNTFAGEAITGATDGTGGYWVVVHDKSTANTFRVWHFTSGGITGPTDYTVGSAVNDVSISQSYLKVSPCQDKIAYNSSGGTIVVHSFNRTTGVVGGELDRITHSIHGVGLEFSTDGNRIFYSGQNTVVKYFDINGSGTASPSTDVTGSTSWSMQMGPDGNIYASPAGNTVGVISNTTGSPTWSTIALPAPGSTFRGLINIVWLPPAKPNIYNVNCPTVNFTHDLKTYFGGDVAETSVAWDFGDTGTGSGASPSHTYAINGTYTITMTVTDATCSHTFSNTKDVTIGCIMPVEWLNIDAKSKGGNIVVNWATATEKNNDYFIVQRSSDGVSFAPVGKVKGNGNSGSITNYEFTDSSPLAGENYYRVVQYDINDDFSTSDIVSANSDHKIFIGVSPNPTQNEFKVEVIGATDAVYSVTDVLGKELLSNTIGDLTNFSFGKDFAKGTYILKIVAGGKVYTEKLVKE